MPILKALCLDLKFEEERKIKEASEEVAKFSVQIRQHFVKCQQILDAQNEAIEKKIEDAGHRHGSPNLNQLIVGDLETAIDNRIATLDVMFDKIVNAARRHPKLAAVLN